MDEDLPVSLDKLPIKRLEVIEENGIERFPAEIEYDEKKVNQIRRVDFAWAVEREDTSKKQKKSGSASTKETSTSNQSWQWQSMVENLQLAHQELSVIIDLINTVEANDAVTVAGMTRPKPLPNELISDLAVSTATKLQCFRASFICVVFFMQHLGKYFKQSAKGLEQQVAREARFYGALIRLQQNWKIKRHRTVVSAPGNEGFYFDLFDNSLCDSATAFRPSSTSTVRVEHDPAGMLAVNLLPNSCCTLRFEFLADRGVSTRCTNADSTIDTHKEPKTDDDLVKETHSVLRGVHQAIFYEQVFDLVNCEAFNQTLGVNVTGIRENYLVLDIGQGVFISVSLVSSGHKNQDSKSDSELETAIVPMETSEAPMTTKAKDDLPRKLGFPSETCFEIYLQQIFHEHVFVRARDRSFSAGRTRLADPPAKDGLHLLGHFCMSLSHRIFSKEVLAKLDALVSRVPYIHLISHPTWHSRTSSWTLSMEVPQSILLTGYQTLALDIRNQSLFQTKVVVNDDSISVEGEGASNVVGLFKGKSEIMGSMNRYECDLADLPVILLQQVASQVIRWLHEEALLVGIKTTRDFLCLSFELEQGNTLSLVAHVDPNDPQGCISWWLVMEDGFTEEHNLHAEITDGRSETRKRLGYLSLDVLYSTVLDLVSLCSGTGIY